jgi:hypothetical protein
MSHPEAGMKTVRISEHFPLCATRVWGRALYDMIAIELLQGASEVEIDFTGARAISGSFLDESIVRIMEGAPENGVRRIVVVSENEEVFEKIIRLLDRQRIPTKWREYSRQRRQLSV